MSAMPATAVFASPSSTEPAAAALDPTGLAAAVLSGAIVIDLRSSTERAAAGVLPGALAISAAHAADRLDPAHPRRLRGARVDTSWVLVSADGRVAAAAAAALAGRGLTGVRWLAGGFAGLSAARATAVVSSARHLQREGAAIAAH